MHSRNQDVTDLFSPASGFYGVSGEIGPYTYPHPNHPKHHQSTLYSASRQCQHQHYIHRGDSNYQTNLTTSLESTGLLSLNSVYAETQCVPNATVRSLIEASKNPWSIY